MRPPAHAVVERSIRDAARLGVLAMALALAAPVAADAGDSGPGAPADPFAAVAVHRPQDLADMRARFTAGGYIIELGANVRTFVDDLPVLETVFSLGDGGIAAHATVAAAPPAGLRLVTGDEAGARIVDLAPPGFDLSAFAAADGVVLTDGTGFTAMLHRVAADQILNVVVSSASERSLRQELDVTVGIRNFTAKTRATRAALLASRLTSAGRQW